MKYYVDELLNTMNTSLAYEEKGLHHIVALAYDAVNGKTSLPYDALAMVLFRYERRLPCDTVEAVANILEMDKWNHETLIRELLHRSGSLVSVPNLASQENQLSGEAYTKAVETCRAAMPKRRKQYLKKAMAHFDDTVRYDLMGWSELVTELHSALKRIGQGVPGSLPQQLRIQLGVTEEVAYAVAVPYLLFYPGRLKEFFEAAIEPGAEPA